MHLALELLALPTHKPVEALGRTAQSEHSGVAQVSLHASKHLCSKAAEHGFAIGKSSEHGRMSTPKRMNFWQCWP